VQPEALLRRSPQLLERPLLQERKPRQEQQPERMLQQERTPPQQVRWLRQRPNQLHRLKEEQGTGTQPEQQQKRRRQDNEGK
jgi:hypothetical protein